MRGMNIYYIPQWATALENVWDLLQQDKLSAKETFLESQVLQW